MRTTVLGSLLDAARAQPRPRRRRRRPLRVRPRLPDQPPTGRNRKCEVIGPSTRWRGFAGERPAPFHEPHRIGALAVGPLAPASWRGGGEPADFFALKGVLEALAAPARRAARLRAEAASPSCIRAGPARVEVGGAAGRLDRRGPPARLPRMGRRGRGRLRSRPRGPGRRRPPPARRSTTTSPASRPSARTSPSSCPRGDPPPRVALRRCSPAAASCCARPRSSTSTKASRSAPGSKSLALRLEFRRRRPHPHRGRGREAARRDRGAAWARSEGRLRG